MARARLLRKVGGALTLERSYEPAVSMYRDAARLLDVRDDRDQAWWHERLQVVVDEILLNYWRNDTSRMAALDAAFASEVSAHGSDRQRIDYLTGRMMTRLRTSRYAISGNILEASQEIIDLAADDPDPAHHAFVVFNHGFCHLWRRELPEARRRFHEARRLAERGGDATVMLRCETYLAVAERFAGEIGRCRDHALAAQALAATTGMVEYDGAAKGNLAWIARREGRPDDARALALGAIEDWAPLPLVYGFTWLARMPLLAVHGTNGAFELAAAQAAAMVEPSAQRLHDPMPDLLVKAAVGERSATIDLVDAAEPLGYC